MKSKLFVLNGYIRQVIIAYIGNCCARIKSMYSVLSLGGACHCDSNDDSRWLQDAGYISDMDLLPVTRLQFGDTGSPGEEAYFTLGPLRCYSSKCQLSSVHAQHRNMLSQT